MKTNEKCDCFNCGDTFNKQELRPKKYERSLLVCENCYEQDLNDDENDSMDEE